MTERVAIVGVGWYGFKSITPEVSYKEMMYEAAVRAYHDAGIDPRRDVDSFVTVAEDFNEGTSIFDEYTPDQMGGILRPNETIPGEGLHGLITAYMQIKTGLIRIAVVEAHSKASNILHPAHILAYAMDPVYNRPLGLHPYFIAGLEMQRYLFETGTTLEQCAQVVVKNRQNALLNPLAAYPAELALADVLDSEPVAEPLTRLMVAPPADGCVVMVLAAEEVASSLTDTPIWIQGVGWANGSYSLENRDWVELDYVRQAAEMAYRTAGIRYPRGSVDLVELDDAFAYKELQHLEALSLCRPGEAGILTVEGATSLDGDLPVNPSGGSLGCGHLLDASGLARALEVVLQLRGEAGAHQVPDVAVGMAMGWRGIPTTSAAVVILARED
ncbi:MAG: thiolase C-terminal domain-containing protein [Chloroflexia bacterium]